MSYFLKLAVLSPILLTKRSSTTALPHCLGSRVLSIEPQQLHILIPCLPTFFPWISAFESQKGIITIQWCSIENQKGAIAVQTLWWYYTLLVLNGTSWNCDNALLVLNGTSWNCDNALLVLSGRYARSLDHIICEYPKRSTGCEFILNLPVDSSRRGLNLKIPRKSMKRKKKKGWILIKMSLSYIHSHPYNNDDYHHHHQYNHHHPNFQYNNHQEQFTVITIIIMKIHGKRSNIFP